jgi:peptidoglycan hydrolase CwlO-like protein
MEKPTETNKTSLKRLALIAIITTIAFLLVFVLAVGVPNHAGATHARLMSMRNEMKESVERIEAKLDDLKRELEEIKERIKQE